MQKKHLLLGVLGVVLSASVASAQTVGIFDKQADWAGRGTNKVAGSASVAGSGASAVYTMMGNGDDIWDAQDEGFFLYTEKTGDWTLTGKVAWVENDNSEWSKVGVMIREKGATINSRHYWVELRGQGFGDRMDPQWRSVEGGASSNIEVRDADGNFISDPGDGLWLRVTRLSANDLFISEYSQDGTNWVVAHANVQPGWTANAAYGLAITNHQDNTNLVEATVSNVSLAAAAFNKPIAFRSFSTSAIAPNGTVDVTVKVVNPSGTLTETLPTGWTASAISNGGTASANVVTWNLAAGVTEVKYTAKAPASVTANGFTGTTTALTTLGSTSVGVLQAGVGAFNASADVGNVGGAAGTHEFAGGTYTLQGSGADIWGTADGHHFLFNEMSGAFSIKTNVYVYTDSGDATWAKAGLMIRDSLDAGAVNAFLLVRSSDQRMIGQWRPTTGVDTSNVGDAAANDDHDGIMEIQRLGSTVNFYRYSSAGDKVLVGSTTLPNLQDPVYVGLAITSHSNGNLSSAEFSGVQVTPYDAVATRSFSSQGITKEGGVITATVKVDVTPGKTSSNKITETVPAGMTPTNIKASNGTATAAGGTITWTLASLSGSGTLTYDLTFPANTTGVKTLSGSVDNGLPVNGPTQLLPVNIQFPFKSQGATLDGVIGAGEWDGAYTQAFSHEEGDATAPGVHISGFAYPAAEESGTIRAFHTADAIYVSVDIVDKVLLDFYGNTTDAWQNDSTELVIDGNLSRLTTAEASAVGFQATVVGDGHFVGGNNAPTPVELIAGNVDGGYKSTNGAYWNYGAKAKPAEDGYVVEYRVDKVAALDPDNRNIIGFDVLMNSGEATGARTAKWAFWNTLADGTNTVGGTVQEYWNNEQGWAVVQLVGGTTGVFDWSTF